MGGFGDMMRGWGGDVRHALRGLRRSRWSALAALLSLSVGVGAATMVATVARSVLLDPLPFPEPDRLVSVREMDGGRERGASPAGYLDWRRELGGSFTELAAFRAPAMIVEAGERRVREIGAVVSGNFFATLGVEPFLGRSFHPALDLTGRQREVVLGYGLWHDLFQSDPAVLGRTLLVDREALIVVGVMPEDFFYPEDVRLWVRASHEVPPVGHLGAAVTGLRDAWYFDVVGRLAPSTSLAATRDQASVLSRRLSALHPNDAPDQGLVIEGLKEATVGDTAGLLSLLVAAVVLLLAATCANVAGLTLVRSMGERRELAVRQALGASRWRNGRLVVTRTLVVAAVGGAFGALLAFGALPSLVARLPEAIPRLSEVRPDAGVFLVALGLTTLVGVVSSVMPMIHASRSGTSLVRRGSRTASTGRAARGVVTLEVALAVVLVASALLMGRSIGALAGVDPGFRAEGLALVRVTLPDVESRPVEEQKIEWEAVVAAASNVEGATNVALGAEGPLDLGARATLRVERGGVFEDGPDVAWRPVTAGWTEALGVSLVRGRSIVEEDAADGVDVAVIDRALAVAAFGAENPIGRRVTIGLDGHDHPLTIVGVVASVRNQGPDGPAFPVLYRPLAQVARPPGTWTVAARVPVGTEDRAAAELRRELLRARAEAVVYGETTGEDLGRGRTADRRFLLELLTGFGGMALLLGGLGVYGVASGVVADRMRELGVRRAIGAGRATVLAEVLRHGGGPVVVGLAVGLAGAVGAGYALRAVLFGVEPVDLVSLAAVTVVLLVAVALALVAPASRAMRADPAIVLREE